REKIELNREQAMLSKRLATIITNVPVNISLDELKKREVDYEKLIELFKQYEFNSLIPRIRNNIDEINDSQENIDLVQNNFKENITEVTNMVDFKAVLDKAKEHKCITFKTITEEQNIVTDKIVCLAATITGDEQYYID